MHGLFKIGTSRKMSTRLTNLESKENELDGKFFDMSDITHANSQALVDIKTIF
jgi:hypothetical protein